MTEKTPFVGDIIGISSFGIINAFSHVILKKNNIVHNNIIDVQNPNFIPRLVFASGRNEKNTRDTLNKVFINLTKAIPYFLLI